jgi:hypothetical protein
MNVLAGRYRLREHPNYLSVFADFGSRRDVEQSEFVTHRNGGWDDALDQFASGQDHDRSHQVTHGDGDVVCRSDLYRIPFCG